MRRLYNGAKLAMLHFNSFSHFAYNRRKRFSLESEKENSEKNSGGGKEQCTPIKDHQNVIPETPASLLPSLTVPTGVEHDSPKREIRAKLKKRRQFARIDSSSDEEEHQSSTKENKSLGRVSLSTKRRKLCDSFGRKEPLVMGTDTSPPVVEEHSNETTRDADVSTTDKDSTSSTQHKGLEGSVAGSLVERPLVSCVKISSTSPRSSGWLSSSRNKLQTFAFQKKRKNAPSAIVSPVSDELEAITHRSHSHRRKKVICISDSDSEELTSPPALPADHAHQAPQSRVGKEGCSEVIDLDKVSSDEYVDSDEDDYSDSQKVAILDFINSSSLDELCGIPGCSMTKANKIDKMRCFESWEHLVEAMVSKKGYSELLLEGCLSLLKERKVLEKLLAKCKTLSVSIHERFTQLQGTEERPSSEALVYSQQPLIMNPSVQMKPYQLLGLNWLVLLHSQSLNGILADEMGLGKTVQAISFLAHLYRRGSEGVFLVLVPSSTRDNWVREFEVWCPSMAVVTYWGSQQERLEMRYEILSNIRNYDVILTTYNVCIGQTEDRKFFRKLSLDCLVLDEGHMLKNMSSQRYTHLMKIRAKRRLLLTGTPLQNNLLELMSLLSFVMPDVFQPFSTQIKKTFSKARKVDESSAYYQEQVRQAKQIMRPFTLRRLKSEVLSQLPAKVSCVEHCRLSPGQCELYQELVESSLRETQSGQNVTELLNKRMDVMMNLRKAANHPLLLRHLYTEDRLRVMAGSILREPSHRDADPELVLEDMTVMSDFELHNLCLKYESLSEHTLPASSLGASGKCEYLARKLPQLKENGDRVLVFSQFTMMLDILEAFLEQEGHTHLRLDGSTPVADRQSLIDEFNQTEGIFAFLLSTRAGGLGINLTSANVVIIHDIDFNPYNDKQAEDRCHRVGQKRDVTVIRLVSKDTVEEEMLVCAQSKLKLEQDITTSADTDEKLDIAGLLSNAFTHSNSAVSAAV